MNKYKGSIIEDYGNATYRSDLKNVYYWSRFGRYVVSGNSLDIKLDIEKNDIGEIILDAFWYSDSSGNLAVRSISDKRINFNVPNDIVGRPDYSINSKVIGSNNSWNELAGLFVYDTKNNDIFVVRGNYGSHSSDGASIFARDFDDDNLVRFNLNLIEIWRVKIGENNSWANPSPFYHDDLVVLTITKKVLAFRKSDGEMRWQHELLQGSGCMMVDNGLVYLSQGLDILILDAHTGQKIIQKPIDFKLETEVSFNSEESRNMMVYPVNAEVIIAYATGNPEIKFISSDGETCFQSLSIEDVGYMLYTRNNPPLIKDEKIYIPITNRHTSFAGAGGLLVLEPANEHEPIEIKRQERYPYSLCAVPSLGKEHHYSLYMDGEKLEHICRYAGIIVKELIYETGYIPSLQDMNEGPFDYLHNGLIEIIIDPQSYTEKDKESIDDLMSHLNKYLETARARAGIQIYGIKLKLSLQKKPEWKLDGELVNLDEIIRKGKPLNKKPNVSPAWID